MISRHWKGISKRERSKDYIEHLQNDTFKILNGIDGFLSAQILQREIETGIEFLIVTNWRSIEAIKKFAGENYEIAVVPNVAKEMMLSYDESVSHFEVMYTTEKE